MKLNRDVLITAIIKHQHVFYTLLDYIDNHDGSFEFPEILYLNLYHNDICTDNDPNIQYHLSIASLIENGVFIHNDKNTGMITVERVIVDLLRFLDIKRAKELTHSDFEHLRRQIADVTREVELFDPSSQDYHDAMKTFNGLMSEIHSRIKENVSGLTAQVESIAKEYKVYDAGSDDVNVFDLYEKVTLLYTRYVLPCYEFINPDMEMVRTKTFSKAVQGLIEYHSETGLKIYQTANTIQFRKTAITSYYKNIASLVRKLEQFSSHLEQDRNGFLAIESAFSELMDNIVPLRHGKQRYKYLTPTASIFNNLTVLDGLTVRKSRYSMRMNWTEEITKLRFKEYLVLINDRHLTEKDKKPKPLPPTTSISQERQILISKIIYRIEKLDQSLDIHRFIYDLLREGLEDFELADVLFGLEAFLPTLDQEKVTPNYNQQQLADDNYYLNYVVLQLGFTTVHF